MGEYMVMIWHDEAAWHAADDSTVRQTMQAHDDFERSNAGALRGGNRLRSSGSGASIRDGLVRRSRITETKEVLGGYYLSTRPAWTRRSRSPGSCPHRRSRGGAPWSGPPNILNDRNSGGGSKTHPDRRVGSEPPRRYSLREDFAHLDAAACVSPGQPLASSIAAARSSAVITT